MSRGEVWMVRFDPVEGREQAGTRPALVVSVDQFNRGLADLVIVAPITSRDKRQPFHVAVEPPEGGLTVRSFIKSEDVRSISKGRLERMLGRVARPTLTAVDARLRILLGL